MQPTDAGRAPFLLVLLPFACGIVAAEAAPPPVAPAACVALVLAAAAAWRAGCERLWLAACCAAALGAGLAAGAAARPSAAGWEGLPAREATVLAAIERVHPASRRPDGCAGFARILAAPVHLGPVAGARIAFSVTSDPRADAVVPGATVRLRGLWEAIALQPEPGSFDAFCVSAGAAFALRRARAAEVPAPSAWGRWCLGRARWMERVLQRGCAAAPREAAVYAGMLLGRTSLLDDADRDLFRRTGTTHLFAISGMHITVVAGTLLVALRIARVPRWPAALVALALVYTFVCITGSSVSAQRAFLAAAFLVAGHALQERTSALAAWSFAALGVLALDPRQAFQPGFQLSYLVVLALVTYAGPLAVWGAGLGSGRRLVPDGPAGLRRRRRLLTLTGSLAVSLAAFVASAPLVATLSGLFTPGSILANLLLVPLSSLALIAGLCALAAASAGIPPDLFNLAGCALVACMREGALLVDALPGSATAVSVRHAWAPAVATAAVVATLLAGASLRWRPRLWFLAPPVVLLAALLPWLGPPHP